MSACCSSDRAVYSEQIILQYNFLLSATLHPQGQKIVATLDQAVKQWGIIDEQSHLTGSLSFMSKISSPIELDSPPPPDPTPVLIVTPPVPLLVANSPKY